MFDDINGLPVHALAVHAAVVMVLLAALLGVLFAVPRLRNWSRIPLVLVAPLAAFSVFVAKESGNKLSQALGLASAGDDNAAAKIVRQHAERADLLFIFSLIFAAVAVTAAVLSKMPTGFTGPVSAVMSAVLVVGAVALAFQTFRVGETGAQAVWNPTGEQNYHVGG